MRSASGPDCVLAMAAALLAGGGAILLALNSHSTIDTINPAAANSFDPILVKRGRQLAAIGNCSDCHTARGGADFAGGVAVSTPTPRRMGVSIRPGLTALTRISSFS